MDLPADTVTMTADMDVEESSSLKQCKPRPKEEPCDEQMFGCCRDGKTAAKGPFQEGLSSMVFN